MIKYLIGLIKCLIKLHYMEVGFFLSLFKVAELYKNNPISKISGQPVISW